MIKKFNDFINESLLDKMKGKTKKDILKQYGLEHTSPEDFFLEITKGIKIKEQTKYSDSIFWEKDGKILFEQRLKRNSLFVHYKKIWRILNLYDMNYKEVESFISELIESGKVDEKLNWKGFKPIYALDNTTQWWYF